METSLEDGIYLAVPYNVHVIFSSVLLGWIDDLCMHTTYQMEGLERRI